MSQSHYALRQLSVDKPPDKDVLVQLSTRPSSKCVVFVHGYGGDPLATWSDFPGLLQLPPSIPNAIDYIYYGYDAIRDDLTSSAAILRNFLGRILSNPTHTLGAIIPTRADGTALNKYSDVVVVAHSLGAVIVRRAIVDATMQNESWVQSTKMVFFAPAHSGASVVDLVKSVRGAGLFGALVSMIQAGAQLRSPLIAQLAPGSAELAGLADDVR